MSLLARTWRAHPTSCWVQRFALAASVVRLDNLTLEVQPGSVEIIFAPNVAPHLRHSARFATRTTGSTNPLTRDLERVTERTGVEIEAAIEAANAPRSD